MNRIKIIMMAMTLMTALAADAKELDLKEIAQGGFRGQTMGVVRPLADGETYAQLSEDGTRIVQYSYQTGKEKAVLFDVTSLADETLTEIDDFIMSPDGHHILLQTDTKSVYRHSMTATYYIYKKGSKHLIPLSGGGPQQTPLFSPDGRLIAFVRDNNIFLVDLLADHGEIQVTMDGSRNEVINGIPDWVNEEEFGHSRAMVFTANGQQLVWVRYDESLVKEFSIPMFKGMKPERSEYAEYPGNYTYKYPIAGETNARCSVWSYDIKNHQTRQLQVPLEDDGYVPSLHQVAHAEQVAVFTMNRHQDCLRLYLVHPLTVSAQLVVEEKVDKYVREEVIHGICITGEHILLPSDRDGNMHLYLYDMEGKLLRQVDQGDYEVSTVYGFDERTGNTYFASHEAVSDKVGRDESATEQHIWVVQPNGKRKCLTPVSGWHTASFSKNYRYFIHSWSNLQTPAVYELCAASGKSLAILKDNHELQKKLADYQFGSRELFTLTTADGVRLNGWMVKPANFDMTKKYPVIMYQYGGPGNQQVRNAWAVGMSAQGMMMEQYLAQQGFICVCVDNRGTGGRGVDFEKCTYLKLGQLESHDQVEAALWLGRQSYVDKDRIAIWGWSFGGFNTLMSMSEGREVFRAGIAIAPPTSWRYYDTIYTERYMRTPQENPEGYDDCPISRADKLYGALMLCHGMADDNVHYRNTAEYTEALVQADKDFRQLVYTNRNHGISGGNTRYHLFRQCVAFFKEQMLK